MVQLELWGPAAALLLQLSYAAPDFFFLCTVAAAAGGGAGGALGQPSQQQVPHQGLRAAAALGRTGTPRFLCVLSSAAVLWDRGCAFVC